MPQGLQLHTRTQGWCCKGVCFGILHSAASFFSFLLETKQHTNTRTHTNTCSQYRHTHAVQTQAILDEYKEKSDLRPRSKHASRRMRTACVCESTCVCALLASSPLTSALVSSSALQEERGLQSARVPSSAGWSPPSVAKVCRLRSLPQLRSAAFLRYRLPVQMNPTLVLCRDLRCYQSSWLL